MPIGASDAHKISPEVNSGTVVSDAKRPMPIRASDAHRKEV
jgi:hypothetical protein